MKSEKHQQKKKEIIDTAFKVWNKNCYFSTSLKDIAEDLGITKQAIYRYFKGKKDLLAAMENQVLTEYSENSRNIIRKIETLSTDAAVEQFIMNQISFFRKNSEYLNFLISKVRLKDLSNKEFQKIVLKQSEYLQKKLSLPLLALNYIMNLIVFYTLIDDRESVKKLSEKIGNIFKNGFGTEFLIDGRDNDKILQEMRISSSTGLESHKVLMAISDAVLENGPQASMDQIAKKAGMTKSSLYFYFKNKEEMISQTMNGMTEKFTEYYYRSLSTYNLIGEQLFAHFVITASMIIEMPKTIPMIHWFVTRGMAEKLKKPTEFEHYRIFFENAVNYRYLNTHGVTADKLLLLVNFCITYEIMNIERENLSKEEKYRLVYGLYDIFANGFKGLKGEY